MLTFTIALENALLAREKIYFVLLLTTLSHFLPHIRLVSSIVKRKHAVF